MKSTRKEALLAKEKAYFTGNPCIQGHVAARRASTGECLECRKINLKVWRQKNPEKVKAHNDTQYLRYPEIKDAYKARRKKYEQNNPHKVAAKTAKYIAAKRQRMPIWVDDDHLLMIEEAYELAALRTKNLGFPWHVDHIIPLRGKNVSGLHVIQNLQVIPGIENVKKSNRYG